MFTFSESTKRQIKKVVQFANENVYQIDDILDMMNFQMSIPGKKPEHLVVIPIEQWICYYIVNHPIRGHCHYFHIKPDVRGKLPDNSEIEFVLKEFGITKPLLENYVSINEEYNECIVIIPFNR